MLHPRTIVGVGHHARNLFHRRGAVAESAGITIRIARAEDAAALVRLAALDSAEFPGGAVLLAETGGAPLAAVPLSGGRTIADPFQRTLGVVQILELRAAQLRSAGDRPATSGLIDRIRAAARALSPRTH